MPTKPWPTRPKKKDSKPSTYRDLSVEILRIVPAGPEQIYFFVWCWDMDSERQTSVLFRGTQFDRPGERLSAIDSEIVDAFWHDGTLLALENGVGAREGFGTVHELTGDFSKPKKSTKLKQGSVYKALGGTPSCLYAVGDKIQRFDGKSWKPTTTPAYSLNLKCVASNASFALAAGDGNLLVKLDGDVGTIVQPGSPAGDDIHGVYVSDAGVVSLAGRRRMCLQGPLGKFGPLDAPQDIEDMNDCCEFQGKYYWSASGERGGVYVQNAKQLVNVFDDADCWSLTATADSLFAASADGVARFDGKQWQSLHVKYDVRNEVWSAVPATPRKKKR